MTQTRRTGTRLPLQQYLPLAVLKLIYGFEQFRINVATVLTACGIETVKNAELS